MQTGISLSSRRTAKLQKLPSPPGDAWEWSAVGELLEGLAWIPWNVHEYRNCCLEDSDGKWSLESWVRLKAG